MSQAGLREPLTGSGTPVGKPSRSIAIPVWRSVVLVCLAALTVLAVRWGGGVNGMSVAGVDMHLPDSFRNYLGFDEDVTDAERRILPPDTEFAKKRYVGGSPTEVNCEIVLSGQQKSSIHRPQVCLLGQGWTILQETPVDLPLAGRAPQRVRVLTLSREDDGRTITGYFLYWFVGQNRTTDDHLRRILYTSWDRVMHGVNHRWAYVIVSGMIPGGTAPGSPAAERTLRQLEAFAQELIPAIQHPEVNAAP